MSHLNKLSASELAEKYVGVTALLAGLKSERKELTKRIKMMAEDVSVIGDDLIEYMNHFKCMIPLRDGRVMEIDKAKRRVAKTSAEKREALEEALSKTNEVEKSELIQLFSKALGSGVNEKPVIIIDEPKKLAEKKSRAILREQAHKEKRKTKKGKKSNSSPSTDESLDLEDDPISSLMGKKKSKRK